MEHHDVNEDLKAVRFDWTLVTRTVCLLCLQGAGDPGVRDAVASTLAAIQVKSACLACFIGKCMLRQLCQDAAYLDFCNNLTTAADH